MGRLENIVSRNREAQQAGARKLMIAVGIVVMLIVIAVLLLFTDLGKPNVPPPGPPKADGVYIGKPPAAKPQAK